MTLNADQSIIDQTDKEFWFNIFSTLKIMYGPLNIEAVFGIRNMDPYSFFAL